MGRVLWSPLVAKGQCSLACYPQGPRLPTALAPSRAFPATKWDRRKTRLSVRATDPPIPRGGACRSYLLTIMGDGLPQQCSTPVLTSRFSAPRARIDQFFRSARGVAEEWCPVFTMKSLQPDRFRPGKPTSRGGQRGRPYGPHHAPPIKQKQPDSRRPAPSDEPRRTRPSL